MQAIVSLGMFDMRGLGRLSSGDCDTRGWESVG
jgi:hypothetical protein